MIQAFYAAKQGMIAHQRRNDVTANNIANINTSAFKENRADFKNTMYKTIINPAEPESTANLMCGSGIRIGSVSQRFTQGKLTNTGCTTDLAIRGDGFFTVLGKDGTQKYTRNGSFAVSRENDGSYLVTAGGEYVLDTDNNKIELQEGSEFTINETGDIIVGNTVTAKLNIVTFTNKNGLSAVGNSSFAQTAASGQPEASDVSVKQGFVEDSNVDLVKQMTQMIRAQRAFSMAGRALAVTDEMNAAANSMR